MKQCEQCGAAIVDGMAFCTNCGAPVNNTAPAAPAAPVSAGAPAGGITSAGMAGAGEMPGGMSAPMDGAPAQGPANPAMANSMAMGTGAALKDISDRPKNNKALIISLAAACVVCLTVGIVGIVMAVNGGSKNDDNGQVATSVTNTVDATSSGTKVQYEGYEFTIPDGYVYDVSAGTDGNEYLYVTDDENEWMASIGYFEDATFAQIKSNISVLADYAVESGYATTATSGETEVDGLELMYIDMMGVSGETGVDLTYAYAKAGLYYFEIIVANANYDIDHSYLEKVAPVVASAKQKKTLDRAMEGEGEGFTGVGTSGRALVQGASLTAAEE